MTCPRCGSEKVLPILYGLPAAEPDGSLPSGVIFGGCTVWPDQPTHGCSSCDHRWKADKAKA